jgi:hypothetical protein
METISLDTLICHPSRPDRIRITNENIEFNSDFGCAVFNYEIKEVCFLLFCGIFLGNMDNV